MDAFVALTDIDEENMVVSMFANKMKVRKTITQIKSDELYGIDGALDMVKFMSAAYRSAKEDSRRISLA